MTYSNAYVMGAIVPPPCGRQFGNPRWPVTCAGEDRCRSCTDVGTDLVDAAFTLVTDARDDEGKLCRAMSSLSWNLIMAALLHLARSNGPA